MSYALNHSGVIVHHGAWKTFSGADGKQYIYQVKGLREFLIHTFGKPDSIIKNPKPSNFAKMKGILVFNVTIWDYASGHATLWDGYTCSDHCYFPITSEASIWLLK